MSHEINKYEIIKGPTSEEDPTVNKKVKVKYEDNEGIEHVEEFDHMPSRVFQHEFDHMNGTDFTKKNNLNPFKNKTSEVL